MDLEKVFFLYESRVNCQLLKPEQTKKFECVDDVIYYRSWVINKTQFMLPMSSMLTLRLQKSFGFNLVIMAGALKVYISVENVPENVKIVILVVNKSINYLLFRVYSTEELMIKAATTMAAAGFSSLALKRILGEMSVFLTRRG